MEISNLVRSSRYRGFSNSLIKSHHVCAAFMFLCALVAKGNSQRINKTTERNLLSRIMDSRIIFSEKRHKGENLVPRHLAQGLKTLLSNGLELVTAFSRHPLLSLFLNDSAVHDFAKLSPAHRLQATTHGRTLQPRGRGFSRVLTR